MQKSLSKFWKQSRFQSEPQSSLESKEAGRRDAFGVRVERRLFILLALALVLYFIAGNIGSGWLYLMCAGLAAALLLGSLLPFLEVLAVHVEQSAPQSAMVGEAIDVHVNLRNDFSSILPIQLIRLVYQFRGDLSCRNLGPQAARIVANLGKRDSFVWRLNADKRGAHKFGNISLESSYPLGLLWARRLIDVDSTKILTIFPKVVPIKGFFLYRLPPTNVGGSAVMPMNIVTRQSTQTVGVREYARGDSPRIIHWASSARTGRLLVREFEAEGMPRFDVLLNLCSDWTSQEQFELAVTTCASLLELGHSMGIGPRLILNPPMEEIGQAMNLPATAPGIEEQMHILARVNPIAPDGETTSRHPRASYSGMKSLVEVCPIYSANDPISAYVIGIGEPDKLLREALEDKPNSGGARTNSIVNSEDDIGQL